MKVEKDYEELLRSFNRNRVRYCIIGAFAVAFYARPRYTKDLDVLVEPSPENGKRVVTALNEFGFKSLKLSESDFNRPGKIVQLGLEPVRVDILTSVEGCSFEQAWKNKKTGTYGRERVFFIGLNELVKNKKKSKRKQDQVDLDILKAVKHPA